MFGMQLSDLVYGIKELAMPRGILSKGSYQHKAMHLCFDVGLSSFVSGQHISRRSIIHILLYSPYNSNVHTFFAIQGLSNSGGSLNELEWRNTSNHDSCWRSDGVNTPISRVYFEMANGINEDRAKLGLPKMAPKDMNQNAWHTSNGVYNMIPIKMHPVYNGNYQVGNRVEIGLQN